MNLSREWLLDNGVEAETFDRLLAERPAPAPPETRVLALPGQPSLFQVYRGGGRLEGCWEAWFHGWRPSSKNQKTNRWAWAKARKADDAVIGLWATHPMAPPPATSRRRVWLRVTRKRTSGRMVDPQNLIESLADSLVANRLLVDDSQKWAAFEPPYLDVNKDLPCPYRTIIVIEDTCPTR